MPAARSSNNRYQGIARWLRNWAHPWFGATSVRQRRPAARFAPRLELLEDRLVPSTYTVNDAGDTSVKNLKDETAQTDGGTITLRSAIEQVDYDGGGTILFASGLTIQPGSALPAVFAPTRIDGTLGGATPKVQILGGESIAVGLALGGGSTVRGLVMDGFTSAAITFTTQSGAGTSNILIEDNYLGTDRTGTKAAGTQGAGIDSLGVSVSTVTVRNNVVSGNSYGIRLDGSNNQITNNLVGTDLNGTSAIGNRIGIDLESGDHFQVKSNVVSANFEGIWIDTAHDNTIQQNFIGTDRGASMNLGNQDNGIYVNKGANNTIGGALSGGKQSDGNTIAYNGNGVPNSFGNGIVIKYSSGNTILFNTMFKNANRGIAIYDNLSESFGLGSVTNGPNGLQVAPYVSQISNDEYTWSFKGKPGGTYHIQVFQASASDETGSARSLLYDLPSVTADGNGLVTFQTLASPFCTATATDTTTGNTSEFGLSDYSGDGIYDAWKKHGIDWDLDGKIDLDLSKLGAVVGEKDVFVQVDAMAGYAPQPLTSAEISLLSKNQGLNIGAVPAGVQTTGTALDAVIASFAAAPVTNTDGSKGVRLHLLPTNMGIGVKSNMTWSDFDSIEDQNIGTQAERQQDNWDAIKQSRKLVFRYTLFGDMAGTGDGNFGISDNGAVGQQPFLGPGTYLGGDAIQILIGTMRTSNFDTPLDEATTFMHELGHSLGLGHGGEDDINFKPNYQSIMNYGWALANPELATTDPRVAASWRLDYSHGGSNTISEVAINEAAGIGGTTGDYVPVTYTTDGITYKHEILPETGWADFNGNGTQDSTYSMIVSDPGLHGFALNTFFVLRDYNDWSNLVYNFRNAPDFQKQQHLSAEDEPFDISSPVIPPGSADLAVSQSVNPATTTVGNNLIYTVTVTNSGPSQAANVVLIDTLPAGVQFVSATASQGTFTQTAGGVLDFTLGAMASSSQATFTIKVTPTGPGTFTNQTLAFADTPDPNPGNNASSKSATVTQNLAIASPAAGNIQEGQTYTGSFGFTDTSAGPWTVTVDYGDGSPITTLSFGTLQGSIPLSHAYSASGTFNLTVTATSTASGQTAKVVGSVAVANVPPTVSIQDAIPTTPITAGQSHPFQLQATDSDDRIIYQVNWGDGITEPFVSDSSYLASHTYAAAGSYTIKVTAIDLDGASSTEVDLAVIVAPVTIYYPTPIEQEFLERLNDARANPTAYGQSIGIDLSAFQPTQPEAFNLDLMEAAELHSLDMLNRNYFAHNTPEGLTPQDQAAAAGYTAGIYQSIAAGYGVSNPESVLALYVIDAGVPGAGHRIQMLGVDLRDAGVGTDGDVNTVDNGTDLSQPNPYLTGVVFNDLNRDGKYYAGEGLGGVTITVQGVGSTTTWPSGGYEMALTPGTYTVTASGGGLPAPVTQTVTFTYSSYSQQWNNARLNFTETSAFGNAPDDLVSTPGTGDQHWITAGQTIGYRLQFTNTQTGNPDQQVTISLPLDPNLNPATFAFGSIRIGSTVVSVPAGSQSYSTVVPLVTDSGTAYNLAITATLSAGTATWTFRALNPATGQTPSDPTVGLLPYLESGEVDWSAVPKAALATGTQVELSASITFTANGSSNSASTPTPFNTIDANPNPPTSSVQALAPASGPSFTVNWSGNDGAGPGIAFYNIYVSDNGGPFTLWQSATGQASALFIGTVGHTYGFYSIAADQAGFVQPTPAAAQATTTTYTPTPNALYVANLYGLLLHRAPDAGASYWIGLLNQGAARGSVIGALVNSSEYLSNVVTGIYQHYLQRTPDAGGLKYWVGVLQGGETIEQVIQGFIASPEFYQVQGGNNNTGFVTVFYQDILGRKPDSAGLTYWVNSLTTGAVTRAAMPWGFLTSLEYRSDVVGSYYQLYLGRPADAGGISYWTTQMQAGLTDQALVTVLLGSSEAYGKWSGYATYVGNLYSLLLHRPADAGAAGWVNALVQGMSPSTVIGNLENSQEYQTDILTALFQHYLHRNPDSTTLPSFVAALQEGATVEQLIDDLVSSTEFFQNAGSTNSGLVTAMYQAVLNRAPDTAGYNAWLTALNNGSTTPAAMVWALLTSTEYESNLVSSYYQTYLRRSADPASLSGWVQALHTSVPANPQLLRLGGMTDQAVLAAILGSSEGLADWL